MSKSGHTQKSLDQLSAILDLLQDELTLRDLMTYANEIEKVGLYQLIKLVRYQRRKVNE